ncbi:MAG: hypothetical protein IJ341_01960 [Bacteroidales bacterium]|nr:hypothetical protein [Bacteroidales bacterium]
MYNFYRKDNLAVYVGKVLRISSVINNKIKSVILTLEHRGETKDIWFNNNPSANSSKDMRADIVEKLDIKEGTFLMVIAMSNNDDNSSATGIRVMINGRSRFDTQNLFIGTATVKAKENDKVILSMPVEEYINGKVEIVEYYIRFWNGSNHNDQYASLAAKLIGKSTKIKVAVRCGQVTKKESNGIQFNNTTGYRLIVCYD